MFQIVFQIQLALFVSITPTCNIILPIFIPLGKETVVLITGFRSYLGFSKERQRGKTTNKHTKKKCLGTASLLG